MKRVLVPFLIYICIVVGFLIGASPNNQADNEPADAGKVAIAYAYEESAAPEPEPTDAPLPYDPNLPMVALTFDDGPGLATEQILNAFEEYGGRGTFCVLGSLVAAKEDVLGRMLEQGSEIASHTWEHRDLRDMADSEVVQDLFRVAEAVDEAVGVCPRFVRPPYGGLNERVEETFKDLGVGILLWSVDTEDWVTRDADSTYERIIEGARDGAIILCHDTLPSTGEAVSRAIPKLIEMGYQLVTVSELVTARTGEITAGESYRLVE